jgi:putative Mg2+ transporter-C (MgtC) family protein
MTVWIAALRLAFAFLLGGLVGWEREREDKPAGLRTLILVCLGSCMYVVVAQMLPEAEGFEVDVDPLRIIAGIAQGIGFLGAGTIFFSRGTVHGLTTAAAVWATSAVGVACGHGMWQIALLGALFTVITLRLLLPVAVRIGGRWRHPQSTPYPEDSA